MENTQFHIDRALYLYKKLLSYKSDFICIGIEKYFITEYCDKKQINFVIFYYLYDFITNNTKYAKDNKIGIKLPQNYNHLNLEIQGESIQISFKEGFLNIVPINKETQLYSLLPEKEVSSEKETSSEKSIISLLKLIRNNTAGYNETDPIPSPFDPANDAERSGEVLKVLFQYVEKKQSADVFKRWYTKGIENISCKIFNEFVLSLTLAEYIRNSKFTDTLKKFEKALSDIKWEFEIDLEPSIPLLIHTINIMAVRYQLFCRQVQSQLIRKPDELYFCMGRNIETELESVPILGLCKFKPDNSERFVKLFTAVLDICFIDHRFILEQQTVERLIYSLETIKNLGKNYFNILANEWEIKDADVQNLENLEKFAHMRIGATKLILKLVYAKACTLWGKMHSFLQNPPYSENIAPFPSIKIIDRQDIKASIDITDHYSESIIEILQQNSEKPIPDNDYDYNTHYIKNLNRKLVHNCYDDIDLYNKQVTFIRLNFLWFKEKEEQFDDYKTLKPENVIKLYNEYRQRKTGRKADNIIFFSDKFLVAALDVIDKDIDRQLVIIGDRHITPSYNMLNKVNESINLFNDLIEEMRKLAEFSEKFGLMENQHLFEDSFYSPKHESTKGVTVTLPYERKSYHKKEAELEENIESNCLFMASTHFLPSYPNHYKRLYEEFKEKRRNFSIKLYMELPYFLNRNTQQDIAKERNNNIQIMAVFATIMAFVTASVGALKILETPEGYGKFACIFCLSLLSFVIIIRLFTIGNSGVLYRIITMSLCILGLYFTSHVVVQAVLCLAIVFSFTCGVNHIFESYKKQTKNSDKQEDDNNENKKENNNKEENNNKKNNKNNETIS